MVIYQCIFSWKLLGFFNILRTLWHEHLTSNLIFLHILLTWHAKDIHRTKQSLSIASSTSKLSLNNSVLCAVKIPTTEKRGTYLNLHVFLFTTEDLWHRFSVLTTAEKSTIFLKFVFKNIHTKVKSGVYKWKLFLLLIQC